MNYVIYIVLCRIYFKGALRRGYLAVSLRRISMYGKLVEYIINSLVAEEGDYPRVADMVSKAKDYIEKIEREK